MTNSTDDRGMPELPDEVTVSRVRFDEGYLLTLFDGGDNPDPERVTAKYIRADLCTPAIADGVGVDPTHEELRLGRLIDRAIKAYYDDGDAEFMCNILEGKFSPSQAATDEG